MLCSTRRRGRRLRRRHLDVGSVAIVVRAGGARLLQLRHKSGGSGGFLDLAERVVAAGARAGAPGHRQRSRGHRAAGGRRRRARRPGGPVAVADVRAIVGAAAIVGLSTHTREQIDRALESRRQLHRRRSGLRDCARRTPATTQRARPRAMRPRGRGQAGRRHRRHHARTRAR